MTSEKTPSHSGCLSSAQLTTLETSFRSWAEAGRADTRMARRRILLLFLLIRYTGIKLSEVLHLDIRQALSDRDRTLKIPATGGKAGRSIALAEHTGQALRQLLRDPPFRRYLASQGLRVDPAFVRRKFYERAADCGFAKQLGSPEMIRRARAVELMQGNVPLPAVQRFLGQSTAGLTSSYVPFDDAALRDMTAWFVAQEGRQMSSARNTIHGRVTAIRQGTIQALVEIATISGGTLRAIITIASLNRLQLREGSLVSAAIKAPWLQLSPGGAEPDSSADNRFAGEIVQISGDSLLVEYLVRSADGIEFCALLSRPAAQALALGHGDAVWVSFSCFTVVLHTEPMPLPPQRQP